MGGLSATNQDMLFFTIKSHPEVEVGSDSFHGSMIQGLSEPCVIVELAGTNAVMNRM